MLESDILRGCVKWTHVDAVWRTNEDVVWLSNAKRQDRL